MQPTDPSPVPASPETAPKYNVRTADPAAAAFGNECGLGPSIAQVLLNRGWKDGESAAAWLDPKLAGLSDPSTMLDRDKAATRLADACRNKERVVIFGDYDVDGTTSATILADILEVLGAQVFPLVANRFQGGYGFSDMALDRCLKLEPDIIVTCDCGSSDHARIQRASDAGKTVIVVDHHLVPKETLPAFAFLNPHRPECGFEYKGMCSAGLVFLLGAEVRSKLGVKLDIRPWLDLVALGTVADVAPLDGDNRSLVRAGLRLLSKDKARPGVVALKERAGIKSGQAIGANEIGFRLGPRLNAAGRLGDPTVTLDILRAKTLVEARRLAGEIEDINDARKEITMTSTDEAYAQVEQLYGTQPTGGIVVASEKWHRGVVGIVAARLVDRFDVPSVVIAIDEDGIGHGSGRTPEGVDLHAALSLCKQHFQRFGGHHAAAGMSMLAAEIEPFRQAFSGAAPRPDAGTTLPWVDIELSAALPLPSVSDLRRLEPVGAGNEEPVFALKNVRVDEARALSGGRHLKLRLRVGRQTVSVFGPNLAHRLDEIGDTVTVIGTLKPDLWRGGENLELSLQHLIT